ncbi:MAG: NADAR family protein [Candidatus Sericytochromatia bacterium]
MRTPLELLLTRTKAGEVIKYLFFWGHRGAAEGEIGKGCLSQWWPAPFEVEGVRYPTAEHWMMAQKAILFGDHRCRQAILSSDSPAEAKVLGRMVSGFDETRWLNQRWDVALRGNWYKFSQHPALGAWLLSTGEQVLVEASPLDRIWGIGLDQHHPDAPHPERWPGLNLLGFVLMEVRQALRHGRDLSQQGALA